MKSEQTAFYLLGATMHHGKSELHRLAEEKSFTMEERLCRAAEREICLPSKRLPHELAWLPGVEAEAAAALVQRALGGAAPVRYRRGDSWEPLPPLALCNLSVVSLPARAAAPVTEETQEQTTFLLRMLAEAYEAIRPEEVAAQLNEARAAAGFPAVSETALQEPLAARRQEIVSETAAYLLGLPQEMAVAALTEAVTECSRSGKAQNPLLLDALVAAYELHIEAELRAMEKAVRRAAEHLLECATEEVAAAGSELAQVLRDWDTLAQPIQLSARSRGRSHEPSRKLAQDMHLLIRDLCECEARREAAADLCHLAVELFAEVPEVQELLAADVAYVTEELPAREQMPAILKACHAYLTLPKEREKLLPRLAEAEARLLQLYARESLSDGAADWFALLVMRYAAAMLNEHLDIEGCRALLDKAEPYLRSREVHGLWERNRETLRRNEEAIPRLKQREKELNEAAEKRYRARRDKRRRKVRTLWGLMLAWLVAAACTVLYLRSEHYAWVFYSAAKERPVMQMQSYLESYPHGRHAEAAKERLAAMLRERLAEGGQSYRDLLLQFRMDGVFDPEPVMWADAKESRLFGQLKAYAQCFPENPHLAEAEKLMHEAALQAVESLARPYTKEALKESVAHHHPYLSMADTEPVVYADMQKNESIEYYRLYHTLYPEEKHAKAVGERLTELAREQWRAVPKPYTQQTVEEFAGKYPEMPREEMEREVEEWLLQSADLASCRRFYAWEKNITKKKALYERIAREEAELWVTTWNKEESEARLHSLLTDIVSADIKTKVKDKLDGLYRDFSVVSRKDTKEAYEKFLALCPRSPHAEKARKRLIDLEVAEIAAGEHGELPASKPVSPRRRGSTASIELKNDTSYPITVLYSGPDSRKQVIPAHGTRDIKIKTGSYRIAVTTEQPRVHPFYGCNEVVAGDYIETFYIRTETVPSYSTPSYRTPSYSSPSYRSPSYGSSSSFPSPFSSYP